jgi:hypothetical protein
LFKPKAVTEPLEIKRAMVKVVKSNEKKETILISFIEGSEISKGEKI